MNENERVAAVWATPPTVKSLWQSKIYYQTTMRLLTGGTAPHFMHYVKQNYFPDPAPLALSIGCGWGDLDRIGYDAGLFLRCHGVDLSPGALEIARGYADHLHHPFTYNVFDVNADSLDGKYPLIFANASLHHVDKLERLYGQINNALEPGGLFFFHEYCGPSRFQWTEKQLNICNRLLALIPLRLRGPVEHIQRMTHENFMTGDPSEAIHSKEILSLARLFFDVVEIRNGGTTLTHPLINEIVRYFDEDDELEGAILRLIFLFEEILIEEQVLESDTKLVICRRRNRE